MSMVATGGRPTIQGGVLLVFSLWFNGVYLIHELPHLDYHTGIPNSLKVLITNMWQQDEKARPEMPEVISRIGRIPH